MGKVKYIAAFGIFGIITTEFGVIGILPQLAQHYHVSIDIAGILLSAFALVIAVCGPWMTLLSSGFDRKKVMLLALFLFIVSNILSVLAPSFALQVVARVLPAFLHPVYFASAMVTAMRTTSREDAPKAAAVIFSGVSLATVIGVPFATYMANLFGWQASFVVAGIVNVLAWLSVWLFIPSMPAREKVSYRQQLGILTQPSFLLTAAAASLVIAAMFAVYGYFADYMARVNHLNGVQVSSLLMLFGITGVAGNWIAGKLLSKSVPRTLISFLCLLALIFVLLFFLKGYSPAAVLLIAVWGFVHTAFFLIMQTWMNNAAPGAEDFANSLGVSFGNLGLTLGTTISGWVIATSGIHHIPWVSLALVAAALLLVVVKIYMDNRKYRVACNV